MTEEQYSTYRTIKEELDPIKEFLEWCGEKYKSKSVGKCRFSIVTKMGSFFLHRRLSFASEERNDYKMPIELQNRIIKVVEDYVEEQEKKMEAI